MKIIYHCYGGAHASPVAAAIHLGIIPRDRLPSFSDFRKIPYFDKMTAPNHGKIISIGYDAWGNEICILGRRNSAQLVEDLYRTFTGLTGGDPNEYHFVNCVQLLNPFMVTGGFSSRAMGWVNFGRPIVTFGTILSFPILVRIVNKTINKLRCGQPK